MTGNVKKVLIYLLASVYLCYDLQILPMALCFLIVEIWKFFIKYINANIFSPEVCIYNLLEVLFKEKSF